jgi:hypothetical protein
VTRPFLSFFNPRVTHAEESPRLTRACTPNGAPNRAERVDMLLSRLEPKVGCRAYPWGFDGMATRACEPSQHEQINRLLESTRISLISDHYSCKEW